MNKTFYHRKQIVKAANLDGTVGEVKQLIFATGNTFYPGTRKSLPILLLDAAIKSFGLEWTDEGRIMRVETSRATFIKPKLWQEKYAGPLIREGMDRSGTRSASNVTVLTHTDQIPIGSAVSGVGETDGEKYPFINSLVQHLSSDKFNWTCYGVAPKEGFDNYCITEIPSTMFIGSPSEFRQFYLDCKIPYKDMELIEQSLLRNIIDTWYSSYVARRE
mmetsp:Transcript_128759/g.191910  ORF Transcript_128759/g.191910 Transcript_128759/m.191910 type:complete len:218 (-) Transcript_128759:38-691(-)|eukprot:CAMPEP_0117009326 /NCGR_PEP_ID=MMETSP0472-20121206/8508_1 /TAXON_ID=693140 ORGANISM="Tiarina fusus, Strain LIS" /NCGR_SAMPLE_ID=MMETSP0472 /ASSEMBLY_ACC=CAM_ASM_000603 /LENGTH=217 /DNA_ID=CAMNT_0004711587 /DNA_START=26 /DNA_END=679 /DNA_ORIENTATION=-